MTVPCGTRETPAVPKLCSACKERPRRSPTQRYCKLCHNAAVRAYRVRKTEKQRALQWELHRLRQANQHADAQIERMR
jgi:hypothetical protein